MQILFAMLWNYTSTSVNPAPTYVPGRLAILRPPVTSNGTAYGHQPADIARNGFELEATFGYDWYDRIHISSYDFALGNLIGEQLRTVTVWNAYRRARILEQLLLVNAEGITVFGQAAPPLQFAPLQQRAYNVRISPDGPPVIDATITFDFDEGLSYAVRITGFRITAWTWTPDWSGDGVLERLSWLTSAMRSKQTGKQQKRKDRIAPRRAFEFDVAKGAKDRRAMDAALFAWSSRTWALPIFPDVRRLGGALASGSSTVMVDTVGLDFRDGGLAMLWASSTKYEVVEVQQRLADRLTLSRPTTRAWPQGTRLYPVRNARLTSWPTQKLWHDDAGNTRLAFEITEPCDWPSTWPSALYRGRPVLEERPNTDDDGESTYERDVMPLDGETGLVSVVDRPGISFRVDNLRWTLTNRAHHARMRGLLYALSGRFGALWVPSWVSDLVVVANVAASDVALLVEWCGYTRFSRGAVNRRDIRIELHDGTVFYRRITAWIEMDENTEQLTLDASLGMVVRVDAIRIISFLSYSEGAGDEIEIQHLTDADGIGRVGVNFKGTQNDV